MIFNIDEVEQKIGYNFKDKMLLRKCFTHSSYANEHGGENNEVLEFFGDAIIQFVVTEFLYKRFKDDEGKLTLKRTHMVSKEPLLASVKELGIQNYILLGNGQGKRHNLTEKLYSSLYEAIVAGIYLDGGMAQVKKFIRRTIIDDFIEKMQAEKKNKQKKDSKSALQEYVQAYKLGSISYMSLSRTGPDHNPIFFEGVALNGKLLAKGKGKSKKEAQADSAKKALKLLKEQGGNKN